MHQSQRTTARLTNRRPPTADNQNGEILKLLRERGCAGVTTTEMIYERHILRPGARISELRAMGHDITTEIDEETGVARYRLQRVRFAPPTNGQRDDNLQPSLFEAVVR